MNEVIQLDDSGLNLWLGPLVESIPRSRGSREIIRFDPNNCPKVLKVYRLWMEQMSVPVELGVGEQLRCLARTLNLVVFAGRTLEPCKNETVSLDDCIEKYRGICRYQSFLATALVQLAIQKLILPKGNVFHFKPELEQGKHSCVLYQIVEGQQLWLIDPAQASMVKALHEHNQMPSLRKACRWTSAEVERVQKRFLISV